MTDESEVLLTQADLAGELLAHCSSRQRQSDVRWTEILIYRTPHGYLVGIVGRSVVAGEEDRWRVESTSSAEFVIDMCAPRHPTTNVPRMTGVGRQAVMEAAILDDDLSAAFDDWMEDHP